MSKRRKLTDEYKAKVATDAIKGHLQLAKEDILKMLERARDEAFITSG